MNKGEVMVLLLSGEIKTLYGGFRGVSEGFRRPKGLVSEGFQRVSDPVRVAID